MNYIKKLESEIRKQSIKISALQSIINDLKFHTSLPKFNWPNNSINVDDIRKIIEEGENNALLLIEDQERIENDIQSATTKK